MRASCSFGRPILDTLPRRPLCYEVTIHGYESDRHLPPPSDIELHIGQAALLIDEPLELAVSGCAPGTTVELATTIETPGLTLRSSAVLVAGEDGTVDVARDPSEAGTYAGADPFGLWWSAEPPPLPGPPSPAPWTCALRA
ncbi:MAG: acyl-CoA thioesterase/BAAT N-terminal domain-containing protein, partial [Solirubrobacterales bacterium]|nr:acyl-CoA thioesterase/BAAT N-terminal domain-containing protein [Solirubrobacterales bacterium]